MKVEDVDLLDGPRFAREAEAWFELLRRDDPVHYQPFHNAPGGFWSLTKHADVVAAGRDWAAFSSEGAEGPGSAEGGIAIPDQSVLQGVGTMMIMTDPPRHTRYRKLVNSVFTPRMIAALE